MSEEVIRVRVMRMFPGCQKYVHCCDVDWNPKLENVKDIPKPIPMDNQHKFSFRDKKPDGFDKW